MIASLFKRFFLDGHDGAMTVGEMSLLMKRLTAQREKAKKKPVKRPKKAVSKPSPQVGIGPVITPIAEKLPDYSQYLERIFQLEDLLAQYDKEQSEKAALDALLKENAAHDVALALLRKEAAQQAALAHARDLAERLALAQVIRAIEMQEEEMLISLLHTHD